MNGEEAMLFRDALPRSSIYAFEPNPDNLRLMRANLEIDALNIEIVPLAASNCDGDAEFFVVEADYSRGDYRRGMSSLYRRAEKWAPKTVLTVRAARLDSFLAGKSAADARLALWIDAEGKAYEVIEGMAGVAGRVDLIHVEVETSPCIGVNQKLYPDVRALLQGLGFTEFASDRTRLVDQFNAIFIRADLPSRMMIQAKALLLEARLRYLLIALIRRACPACLRWYQAARTRK
jgi:FkbM family methyltransferase